MNKVIYDKSKNQEAIIVSAMPGAGKSTLMNKAKNEGLQVIDSDSQSYHYHTNEKGQYIDINGNVAKTPNERVLINQFPQNYIDALKQQKMQNDIIFVSSHKQVRNMLTEANIPFIFFAYQEMMKAEIVQRIRERISNQPNQIIADVIEKNWHEWMQEIKNETQYPVIRLKPREYLSSLLLISGKTISLRDDIAQLIK